MLSNQYYLTTKKIPHLCFNFKALSFVILFFTLLLSNSGLTQTVTQAHLPICLKGNKRVLPKCTSQDLEVVSAYLTADKCDCDEGQTRTATLNFVLHNKTGSTRTSFAYYAILNQYDADGNLTSSQYVNDCNGPVSGNTYDTLTFGNQITFTCGDRLELDSAFLAWTDASDGPLRQCNYLKQPSSFCDIAPKCGFPQTIPINPLLTAAVTDSVQPCTGASDGSLTVTASGGKGPYDFTISPSGTQSSFNNDTTVTFTGLSAGKYTITVTDDAGCVHTFYYTLDSHPCCTNPTAPTVCEVPASICGNGKVTLKLSSLASNADYYVVYQTGGYRDTLKVSDAVNGILTFTGLTPGGGFNAFGVDSVSAASVCYGDTTNCNSTGFIGTCATTSSVTNTQTQSLDMVPQAQTKVLAAPNPFNDRIRFTIESDITGQGSLELYNLQGQKVKTVYQGYIEKGQKRNIEYSVPYAQRSTLIYMFRVGDQRSSGKLVGIKQ